MSDDPDTTTPATDTTNPAAELTGPTLRDGVPGSSEPTSFLGKVGGFFKDMLNNYTRRNSSGTGIGAIVGTLLATGAGFYFGGMPGLLMGGLVGFAGSGIFNDIAASIMEWAGMKVEAPSRFHDGTDVKPLGDDRLAHIQELDITIPGTDQKVHTTTIVPRSENYRQMEELSLSMAEYKQKYGNGSQYLGTAINNRLTEIQGMHHSRRKNEISELVNDQNLVFQFEENARRWNELSATWAAEGGDRDRLIAGNKSSSTGLALPELAVPQELRLPRNAYYDQLPEHILKEVTEPGTERDDFLKQSRVMQIKSAYNNIDDRIKDINSSLPGLIRSAKESGDNLVGGRSAGRTAVAAASWIDSNLMFGASRALRRQIRGSDFDEAVARGGMPISNSADAVHQVARTIEETDFNLTDADQRVQLLSAVRRARGFGKKPEQQALFDAIEERVRLEEMRDDMNRYFAGIANQAQNGYKMAIEDGRFEEYTKEVELLRTSVEIRNARVNEMNDAQLRFVERGVINDNNKWVTIHDDKTNQDLTLVAIKKGDHWELTHAYNGRHIASADTNDAFKVPSGQPIADIFSADGVLKTNDIGRVIRDNIVKITAVRSDLATTLSTNLTPPTVTAPTTPQQTPPGIVPPARGGTHIGS